MPLNYVKGNVANPANDPDFGCIYMIHPTTDVGRWRNPLSLSFSRRVPNAKKQYETWVGRRMFEGVDSNKFGMGASYLHSHTLHGKRCYIVSMVVNHGIRTTKGRVPCRLNAVRMSMTRLRRHLLGASSDIQTVHVPKYGWLGVEWEDVATIIEEVLHKYPIYVYDFDYEPACV